MGLGNPPRTPQAGARQTQSPHLGETIGTQSNPRGPGGGLGVARGTPCSAGCHLHARGYPEDTRKLGLAQCRVQEPTAGYRQKAACSKISRVDRRNKKGFAQTHKHGLSRGTVLYRRACLEEGECFTFSMQLQCSKCNGLSRAQRARAT